MKVIVFINHFYSFQSLATVSYYSYTCRWQLLKAFFNCFHIPYCEVII